MTRTGTIRTLVAMLVVGAAVGGLAAPAAGQQASEPTPQLVVALDTDGSAELTLTRVYNLSNEEDRAAFEELQNNATARTEARTAFGQRMAGIAANASSKTGRSMSVGEASLTLEEREDGAFGVAEFGISYEGLAAIEDGELKISEPFATVFRPDRQLVFEAPDDYRYSIAQPPPDDGGLDRVLYEPDTELNQFFRLGFVDTDATPTPTPTPTPSPTASPTAADGSDGSDGGDSDDSGDGDDGSGTTNGGGPGFGALAALTGLVAVALLAVRRRGR